MKEIVEKTEQLNTVETITADLKKLGVKEGDTLLVHTSLSAIGWVNGGAQAVIEALIRSVGKNGTVVMPAQSADLSDPSEWEAPAVPESWWEEIRETMPPYDPAVTPTRGMGKIPELFRTWPGAVRSAHPAVSFAAYGAKSRELMADHGLDFGLGEKSPLARLYRENGTVLMIGTEYETNTSFHLGEYRVPEPKTESRGAPVTDNGRRVWKTYRDIAFQDERFEEAGAEFERHCPVVTGRIGEAGSRLFSLRESVDFSARFFTRES
ncbi:aminoglycoside N(3)-acetyltransferase [Alteribacter natronophilus]|uniref:aminoglycoside N(3)-acetyltransferase n=1 Tax=Alteribacter natronophilus TaxID=2583810 RepID=UPI00110D9695|nr:AAC(3) family N-acetyltransferase [Alteribacter natronophilus]TMW70863.1 AAC(3) family N-acetyltransferase [Alteribacter natronophilus]